MDKATTKKIKKDLLTEKEQLEKELTGFAKKDSKVEDNYNSTFPNFGSDEEENAAEVAAYSDNLSIEHELEKKLRDINKALKSMDDGSYGICKHCKQPIEEGRLSIRPASSSCVACKKKLKGEV